jgi:hypothetical protein
VIEWIAIFWENQKFWFYFVFMIFHVGIQTLVNHYHIRKEDQREEKILKEIKYLAEKIDYKTK